MPRNLEIFNVICRLPSTENPQGLSHICPLTGEDHGQCQRCNLAKNWLLSVADEHPEESLLLVFLANGIALRHHLHGSTIASVFSGVVTPSSPKQS